MGGVRVTGVLALGLHMDICSTIAQNCPVRPPRDFAALLLHFLVLENHLLYLMGFVTNKTNADKCLINQIQVE